MFIYEDNQRQKMTAWLESQLGPVAPALELDDYQEGVLSAIERVVKNEKASIESAPPAVFMPREWRRNGKRIELLSERIDELRNSQKVASHKIESTLESASRAYLIPFNEVCEEVDDIDEDQPMRPDRKKLEEWISSKGISARYLPLLRQSRFSGSLEFKDFDWEGIEDQTIIYVAENTLTQQRKLEAIGTLRKNIPYLAPLRHALAAGYTYENETDFESDEKICWRFLTDEDRAGNEEQRQFVVKALRTPDFAFLWGPPGSGKTTAICELVAQLAAQGKKVLLCASTHVAVDNVIEKLEEFNLCAQPGSKKSQVTEVIPLRIASDPSNVSASVRPYVEQDFIEGEKRRLVSNLRNYPQYRASERLLQAMNDDGDSLAARIAYDSANLICGTTMGFMQYENLRSKDASVEPAFDYVILDECSKTTLDEFMVPAAYGAKWILVGDPFQLFPYSEEEDATAAICQQVESEMADDPRRRVEIEACIGLAQEEQMLRLEGAVRHREVLGALNSKLALLEQLSYESAAAIRGVLSLKMCSVLEQLIGGTNGIPSPLFRVLPGLPADIIHRRLVRLTYQHRMDPAIADFPSRVIYGGQSMLTKLKHVRPKFHLDGRVVMREARKTQPFDSSDRKRIERISPTEAMLALAEIVSVTRWVHEQKSVTAPKVYVISFYRNQRELMERAYNRLRKAMPALMPGVIFHTVDTCQGHEADIVILSFGRDAAGSRSSFMKSFNRVNVSLTRAKSHLVLTRLPKKDGSGDIIDKLHDEVESGRWSIGNLDIGPGDACVRAVFDALGEMSRK
jgi:superfamily I DNA and/or RNA helicase